jgi:hypothetical protein
VRMNRPVRLEELTTGDGRPLPCHVKREIERELDRLELVMRQIREVECERDAMLETATEDTVDSASARLLQLRGIGPSSLASSMPRRSSVTSAIDGRLLAMQDWRHRHGKAARWTANRACPRPATRSCARR